MYEEGKTGFLWSWNFMISKVRSVNFEEGKLIKFVESLFLFIVKLMIVICNA